MTKKQLNKNRIVVAIVLIGLSINASADVISLSGQATTNFTQSYTLTVGSHSTSAIFGLNNGDIITSPLDGVSAAILLSAEAPEPSSWSLMLIAGGFAVLFWIARHHVRM